MDDLEYIISPLFSPEIPFIYPLDWAWEEQMIKSKGKVGKKETSILEENWVFKETDWDLVVELWEEIFISLLEEGSYSILELNNKTEDEKSKWLSQRENIDLFMMFAISQVVLDKNYVGEDERLKLFSLLCEKNPAILGLQGKRMVSRIEDTPKGFSWKELFISPYIIYIEE
jgi:hypothetical protein